MLTHTSAKRVLSIDSRGTKHVKYENKYKNSCGTKHAMHYWLYNTVVLCFTNFHQRPCDPKDVLTLSGKTRAGALMSLWKGAFSLSTSNSTRKPTPNVITKWRQYNSFCWYWNQKKFGIQFSSCTARGQIYIIEILFYRIPSFWGAYYKIPGFLTKHGILCYFPIPPK